MLPNVASRVSPRWLAPLGLAALGTLVLFVASTPEPRAEPQPRKARQHRVGRCGQHATQAKIERRLVEHAVQAKSGQLEACIGTKPFDLVVTRQIDRGGRVIGSVVSGTGSTATSRCFLSVLEQVEFPPITRPLTVTTRLRLEGTELVVDATASR
ncbi:MAG TPA: hypothetical protein VIU61_17780 [Kofleriaceae bacterium]